MMRYLLSFGETIGELCLEPRKNFEAARENPDFKKTLKMFGIVAVGLTLLLLLTWLLNAGKITEANQPLSSADPDTTDDFVTFIQSLIPLGYVLLPIFTLLYVMLAGFIRHFCVNGQLQGRPSIDTTHIIQMQSTIPALLLIGMDGPILLVVSIILGFILLMLGGLIAGLKS